MGIYYIAVDEGEKEYFYSPFSAKFPNICNPKNPFGPMIVMKNSRGSNFEIYSDVAYYVPDGYTDVEQQVYEQLLELFPWAKEFYEDNDGQKD